MRPDKHKKRNHALYAKKAAQKKTKSGTSSSETAKFSDKAARSYCKAPTPSIAKDNTCDVTEYLQVEQPNDFHVGLSSNIGYSSSAKTDITTSFSRRKIESNWEQYDELPEEEENIDHRGADFTLLLTQTAGSQFRFKDEETIDEDTTQKEEEDPPNFISFDCNELARNLQTISLPERLEISRSFFDSETLEILDQDAATSENLTKERLHTTTNKSILKQVDKEETATFDNELENILARSHTDGSVINQSIRDDESALPVSPDVRLQAPLSSQEDETEKKRMPHTGFANHKLKQQPVSNPGASFKDYSNDNHCGDDEELDFLLSLSSPVEAGSEKHHLTSSNEIEELSFRLHEEISTKSGSENNGSYQHKARALPTSSQNPTAAVSSSDVQAESLDDWLDSILDD